MKDNKKTYKILEQLYDNNINEPRADTQNGMADYEDLPYVYDDNEYKTNIQIEDLEEDAQEEIEDKFEDPVITTKKGKNVLREPPADDIDADDITNIRVIDKNGKTLKHRMDDDDIKDLDRSEPEETVNVDEFLNLSEAKNKKEKPKKKEKKNEKVKPKGSGKESKEDEDPNDLGDIAQSAQNTGEQNPGSGQDPNINPNQTQPNPAGMMGGGAYQDPNSMLGIGDQGLGGDEIDPMTGQPKMTLDVIGKVYELKKIYSRLLAVQSQLSFSPDMTLLKLRKFITKAIDLFETVISNIGLYKKEIDDIIVMYYKFIEEVYEIMKDYYKKKAKEEEKENKEQNLQVPEEPVAWRRYL